MHDPTRELLDFLVLGHSPKDAKGWPHPASITVHPRGVTTLINVSMGAHIVNVGGQVPLSRIIRDGAFNENFAKEFDACEARWLVPYLVQLAAGEEVTEYDLVMAYRSKFGRNPRIEASPEYKP